MNKEKKYSYKSTYAMVDNMTIAEELTKKYNTILDKNGINTTLRLAHTWGQVEVESDFIPRKESLNYSVQGLLNTFGRHRISEEDCRRLGRMATRKANQKAIADIVYGGEWGRKNLGNTQVGDGSKFIGRGKFQITGRANYEKLSKDTGIDFISNPDLLLEEVNSIIAMLWYINDRGLKYYMDKDDVLAVSRIINLGNAKTKNIPLHLKERTENVEKYKKIFK